MTTLRDLVSTVRDQARAAQDAATSAASSVETALAPVRDGLTETQHELEQQGAALDETQPFAESALSKTVQLEDTVDTLILDMLMGGGI